MRAELFEPGGCSAWPTSACAMATMRAAGELPDGAAAGAPAPAAAGPAAPGAAVGAVAVTEAVRSIFAKASDDGVAVVVVVAGAAVAGGGRAREERVQLRDAGESGVEAHL